jgi:hypothetical protein
MDKTLCFVWSTGPCLQVNPLNTKLNPICHLLALLAHHIPHISRIRVKIIKPTQLGPISKTTLNIWPSQNMVNSPACHTQHTFKMPKYMKPNYCKSVYHIRNLQHWKIIYALFFIFPMFVLAYAKWFYLIIIILLHDVHKLWSSSLCSFLQPLVAACLRNKYPSQHLVLKPCQSEFFFTQGTTPLFTSIHNQNKISAAWNYILKILYQFNQSNET